MIAPRAEFRPADVAAHYDNLDRFYRELWGEHVHHGLWESGRESPAEAARRLVAVVVERARITAGDAVCDVGCGYGATARMLAHEYGARVTALTISAAQHAYARAVDPDADNPAYLLRDWLANGLPPASFDAVIAIESAEHMTDRAAFFAEAARVLRPGGRLVVCAWLAQAPPGGPRARHLLEPICREGRLLGMGSAADHDAWARGAGLVPIDSLEVGRRVKRTWPTCIVRGLKGLLTRADYRRFLTRGGTPNRAFALTLFRIWLAYELGAMGYGILTAIRPAAGAWTGSAPAP